MYINRIIFGITGLILLGVLLFIIHYSSQSEILGGETLPVTATHYYKANWEWFCEGKKDIPADDCLWRAPGGSTFSAIDLRSTPQMSQIGGTPQGFGVFAYETEQNIKDAEYLGTDKAVVADFVWTKLTTESDPTGLTGPKPLQGSLGSEIDLYLGGEKVKSEPFNEDHKTRAIAVFQSDYRRNITEYSQDTLQKWVGATMEEVYGEKSDAKAIDLVPTEYKGVEGLWKNPETTIGDTFVDTDDVDLGSHTATGDGGGFSWVEVTASDNMEIISNTTRPVTTASNGDRDYRAESDLSTDDMIVYATIAGSAFDGAVEARYSASARTHYQVEFGNSFYRIARAVAGARTVMQESTGLSHAASDKVEIRVNGSTVQAFRNGTQLGTDVTDTNITGHLRSGLNTWEGDTIWDTFVAYDITAPDATATPESTLKGGLQVKGGVIIK